ncbi:MAG: tRNA 2-thiouridine(34) synthase MnmA [Nitrospirota bacterium]|nr:tRNA 2-thiouridine(34) synthase MnmA [Nitrospirota bacterium]
MPKVIVGMSGGVDSSVTAYLLKEAGFEVEGLSFVLWEARQRSDFTACCSLESVNSAAKTAESIGVKHTSVDVRGEFIEKVIEPFVDAYTRGLTPNPCILCNKYIKFPFLVREADSRGAEYIATGHYAGVEEDLTEKIKGRRTGERRVFLKKGIDAGKDQSYVLYSLREEEIKRLMLPLGNYRKADVREIARSLQLDAAGKPESQDICFIEGKNYSGFIEELTSSAGEPGPIIDGSGKAIGTHKGIYRYTTGQRKGLGLSSPEPYYVTKIDILKNTVHVGAREDVKVRSLLVADLNWLVTIESDSFRATVKVRSMMESQPASIELSGDHARVVFDEPQWAPAPGQSAVFYFGDRVAGGGIIVQ